MRAHVAAANLSGSVAHSRTFRLARPATFVATHWRGSRHTVVRLAFSRDGRRFGAARRVRLDEIGEARHDGQVYGALMAARGARAVRVLTSRPLARLALLALSDRGPSAMGGGPSLAPSALARAAGVSQPAVIARVDWGADESLRYDSTGKEIWPPAFYPVQKVIVHHTATQNGDPNPAATIRAIYYYHAVTEGWGDIGYNFLIDESGRIYEGRHTFDYPSGSSPTEQDAQGFGVTAAHTQGYNSGTVGIALLGTLTNQDATPAARDALERLIAWIDGTHGIDPQGSAPYTNPVSGAQATFPNIAGHRDLAATECPGGAFYATLPTIRSDVAALIVGSPPPPPPTAAPSVTTGAASGVGRTSASLNGTVDPNGQATTYWFDWGRTNAYESSTATTNAGSGSTAMTVSTALGGLKRATTYHFRIVARNASGTTTGADATFRTSR